MNDLLAIIQTGFVSNGLKMNAGKFSHLNAQHVVCLNN